MAANDELLKPLKEEEFREEFRCCVCLDLLYKPVVLGCGHVSCFWCVYDSMNCWHESRCPICRHSYNHLPNVCQLLHFLLLKIYPNIYKRREEQVLEQEKETGYCSPHLDKPLSSSHPTEELGNLGNSLLQSTCPLTKDSSDVPSPGQNKSSSTSEPLKFILQCKDGITNLKSPETSRNSNSQGLSTLHNCAEYGSCEKISLCDLQCATCKDLLFRPVVLNCGHAYCEPCIIAPSTKFPRCEVCQSMHPNGVPRICLVLAHFLEEQFSLMYAERRNSSFKQADCSTQFQQLSAVKSSKPIYDYWSSSNRPQIHVGIGCDSCGMSPIVGERYKCKDCDEAIGFDLCEICFHTPSTILGRFNQQHKPEHKFEIIQPESFGELLSRREIELSEDGSEDDVGGTLYSFGTELDLENEPQNVEDHSGTSNLTSDVSQDQLDQSDASGP